MDQLSQYFDRGWVILPVPVGRKKITIPWKALQKDPLAAAKSKAWFEQNTTPCNVALMCGEQSKIIIIDLDPHHMDPNGPDVWAYLDKYPTDLVLKTPRGGLHLYFRYPDGEHLGNSRGDLPKGIDVRGQGGYAMLPPSKVVYDDGSEGEYTWHSFGEPTELPAELLETIKRPKASDSHPTRTENQTKLERILDGDFTPGEHNEELLWAAGYLKSREMPEEAILQLLLIADAKDSTPQGPEQVRATATQAFKYFDEREPVVYNFGINPPAIAQTSSQPVSTKAGVSNKPGLAVMPFSQYEHVFQAEERFLIDNWVPLHSLLIMTAAPETGKTWFLLDMAVSVALGRTIDPDGFLGEFKTFWPNPQNVLIIQQEDQPGKLTQRIQAIYSAHIRRAGNSMKAWMDDHGVFHMLSVHDLPGQIYMLPGSDFRFDREGALERLEQTIVDHDIKLVLIDPLYKLGDSEKYFAEFTEYFSKLKEIRNRRNVTFIIAHHTKKSNEGGRGAAWGSTFLDASSEGQILLFPDRKKTDDDGAKYLQVVCSGKAFSSAFETEGWLRLSTVPGEENVTLETAGDEERIGPPNNQRVYAQLQEGPQTQAEIAKATDMHPTQVKRALDDLMSRKLVDQQKNKKYHVQGFGGLLG